MNISKTLQLCLVLVSSLALIGCVEISEEITISPDGSCDVVLDVGMTQQMIEMAKAGGEESPFDKAVFEKELGADPNVKEFKVEERTEEGMSHMVVRATYKDALSGFDSIGNAMSLGEDEGPDDDAPRFEKLPNGNLKFMQALNAGQEEGTDPQQAQMVAGMFAGRNFTVKLNGDIVSANGEVAADKKSVSWQFPFADLITGKVELEQMEAEIAIGGAAPAAKTGGEDDAGAESGEGAKPDGNALSKIEDDVGAKSGDGAKSDGNALSKILPLAIIGLIVVALAILGMSFMGKKPS